MISSSNPSSHQSVVSLTLERQEDKQHQTAPHIATLSSSKLLTRGSAVVVDQSDALTTLCRLRSWFPLARCSRFIPQVRNKRYGFILRFSYMPRYLCKFFERYSWRSFSLVLVCLIYIYFSWMIYHLQAPSDTLAVRRARRGGSRGSACLACLIARSRAINRHFFLCYFEWGPLNNKAAFTIWDLIFYSRNL